MKIWQHERKDPTKPVVCKHYNRGMWWAQAVDLDGKYHTDCFHTYGEALQQAHEYAAMNQAARALKTLEVSGSWEVAA